MEFRKAAIGDIPSLVNMRILYSQNTYGELSGDFIKRMKDELPAYFEKHLNSDLGAYIALDNGEVVSSAMLLNVEKPINPLLINGRNGIVLNVYTKQEYRRKGLAKKLIETLLSDAFESGLDYVELKATKNGFPLYKKIGFTEKSENTYMIYNFER